MVFEPLDFIARLAALVPTPRVNLTRYHGVFSPNHRLGEQVTPAKRGRRKTEATGDPSPARHVSMTWAQRLKRVFKIDIETCEHCGGAVKVIASIEDAGGDQTDPWASRAASRARDTRLQTVRPRATANGITGPEGIRLTVLCADLRTHARLV